MVTCLCMFIQYKHDFQLATKHWKIWKRNNLVQCGKSEITLRVYSAATTPMRDRKGRNFHSCFKIKAFKASCKGLCDLMGQPEETLQIPTVDIIMNICGNYNCDILWYDIMCVAMVGKTHGYVPSFMICRSTSFNPYQAPGVCSAGFSVVASLIAPHVLSESSTQSAGKRHKFCVTCLEVRTSPRSTSDLGGQPVKEILKLVTPLRSLYMKWRWESRGPKVRGPLQ